jgi:hypothetical protein
MSPSVADPSQPAFGRPRQPVPRWAKHDGLCHHPGCGTGKIKRGELATQFCKGVKWEHFDHHQDVCRWWEWPIVEGTFVPPIVGARPGGLASAEDGVAVSVLEFMAELGEWVVEAPDRLVGAETEISLYCPGHEHPQTSRSPSASWRPIADSPALTLGVMKCFAGCGLPGDARKVRAIFLARQAGEDVG